MTRRNGFRQMVLCAVLLLTAPVCTGDRRPVGPQGETGIEGPQGPQGPEGPLLGLDG